jgi:hypothetical protein
MSGIPKMISKHHDADWSPHGYDEHVIELDACTLRLYVYAGGAHNINFIPRHGTTILLDQGKDGNVLEVGVVEVP